MILLLKHAINSICNKNVLDYLSKEPWRLIPGLFLVGDLGLYFRVAQPGVRDLGGKRLLGGVGLGNK